MPLAEDVSRVPTLGAVQAWWEWEDGGQRAASPCGGMTCLGLPGKGKSHPACDGGSGFGAVCHVEPNRAATWPDPSIPLYLVSFFFTREKGGFFPRACAAGLT